MARVDPDFPHLIEFHIYDFLVEEYPTMTLLTKKIICNLCLEDEELTETLEEAIREWVNHQSLLDAGYLRPEDLEDEEEEEEEEDDD